MAATAAAAPRLPEALVSSLERENLQREFQPAPGSEDGDGSDDEWELVREEPSPDVASVVVGTTAAEGIGSRAVLEVLAADLGISSPRNLPDWELKAATDLLVEDQQEQLHKFCRFGRVDEVAAAAAAAGPAARETLKAWRVLVLADGSMQRLRLDDFERREAHSMCPPEKGWSWLLAIFPTCAKGSDDLARAVERAQAGLSFEGRRYSLVSSSKGCVNRGPVAWLASPPAGSSDAELARVLGYGHRILLEAATDRRPFPWFLLRARVKQLFSCSFPLRAGVRFQVVDDTRDESGRQRDDGAGVVDLQLLRAAAVQRYGPNFLEEREGLRRHVPGSAQIRDYGLKGMLLGIQHTLDTGSARVPRGMVKFDGFGQSLRIISFSVVRPTALGISTALRLEARGVPREVFVEAQRVRLRRLTGPVTRRRAHRLLKAPHPAILGGGDEDVGAADYLGSFASMLTAGFDPTQQPLVSILRKQQEKSLETAGRDVDISGVWSCRGHPEPRIPGGPFLRGLQVFCQKPVPGGGWRVMSGPVAVGKSEDLDPAAIRVVEAVDVPELRDACGPGVLLFSTLGEDIQAGTTWDFDGDYFFLIENKDLIPPIALSGMGGATVPQVANMRAPAPLPTPPLADLQAAFLKGFPCHDFIGLWHWKWQLLVGKQADAALSEEARHAASQYGKCLDVEKGGPRPGPPPWDANRTRWNFMKNSGRDAPISPTAAGAIHDMAVKALAAFKDWPQDRDVQELAADPILGEAWRIVEGKLGRPGAEGLIRLASCIRQELRDMVKDEIAREKDEASDKNISQDLGIEAGARKASWMESRRAKAADESARLGASLEDLALACWYTKYVREEAARWPVGTDREWFPWTIVGQELRSVRMRAAPCCQAEMERLRRALRRLYVSAKAAAAGGTADKAQGAALSASYAAARNIVNRCQRCAEALRAEHAAVWLDELHDAARGELAASANRKELGSGLSEVLEGFMRVRKERLPCSELFFCKAEIDDVFRNGPPGRPGGELVSALAERLVTEHLDEGGCGSSAEARGTLEVLCLEGVRYHGRTYIVEGHRRLWAIRKASEVLGLTLNVWVNVHDLFLGAVRGRPALRAFWDKHTTRDAGASVIVRAVGAPAPGRGDPLTGATRWPSSRAAEAHGTAGSTSRPARAPQPPAPRAPAEASARPLEMGMGSSIVDFGKYSGRRYHEVLRDRGYCKWAVNEAKNRECEARLLRLAQYISSELPAL